LLICIFNILLKSEIEIIEDLLINLNLINILSDKIKETTVNEIFLYTLKIFELLGNICESGKNEDILRKLFF